jgi:hypothetical protein
MQTVAEKVLRELRRKGPGHVFTPQDMLRLGSRAAVDQALSRLARAGTIRRLGRGVYDYPKVSARLGSLTPPPETIARALARNEGAHLQSSGARAANALGLSTQVPGRVTFLTDGTPRTRRVGNHVIELKRAAPRKLFGAGTTAGTVLQALRYLGPSAIDDRVIRYLSRLLRPADKRQLRQLTFSAPGWAQSAIKRIAADGEEHSAPARLRDRGAASRRDE